MSSKKWVAVFALTVVFFLAVLAVGNYALDPFGVFSGPGLQWPSYEMTINPRTAKITYLEQDERHENYDSYIIGCSSSSSFPTEQLDTYYNAHFYNMIMYGADMLDVEQLARYLVENYTVKNLIVSVYIDNALTYDTLPDPLSFAMPAAVTGENPVTFYAKYFFADPRHALDKLTAWTQDTWLPQSFDVFDPATGAYDKRARDAEFLGSLEDYYQTYPVFADYPEGYRVMEESAVAGTMASLAAIRDLCAAAGVNFQVVCAPVYSAYMAYFDWAQVTDFYTRLAAVTPYWDFSYSSVSFEPRYFYDETHFRNCVGKMALARMFGDSSVYIPPDFGAYVTADTVASHLADMAAAAPLDVSTYTTQVPVLMYHHLAEEGNDSTVITPTLFREQIAALSEAGYVTVTPDDLAAYVNKGAALPEKPLVITFDDGYLSNYTYAYPILQEYGMCATIFVVGATVGQTEHYKDTTFPITPHFSYAQAAEMVSSGTISIQSHTYDMHQWADFETGRARENILRWPDEDETAYREILSADAQQIRAEIQRGTGENNVHVLAFPSGQSDTLAQAILLENGFDITFTTVPGSNTIVRGLPQSLLGLHRYTVHQEVSVESLLNMLQS